ncbi:MAG: PRC-barrel domain-containing protein, partial [Acidimicrobiia bacterium]
YAPYAGPRQRAVTDINVPDNSDLIGGDTAVESANGESIGTVAEVTIDEEGRLSHVTVDLDTLGEKVVPAHWIESIGQDKLVLAVGDESLEWLDRPPSSDTGV